MNEAEGRERNGDRKTEKDIEERTPGAAMLEVRIVL